MQLCSLNAARSSGNAAGSNEKQREATGNDLESISSDLQRSTGQRKTREWFCAGPHQARTAGRTPPDSWTWPPPATAETYRAHAASHARTHATQTQAQSKSISRFGVLSHDELTPPTSDLPQTICYGAGSLHSCLQGPCGVSSFIQLCSGELLRILWVNS